MTFMFPSLLLYLLSFHIFCIITYTICGPNFELNGITLINDKQTIKGIGGICWVAIHLRPEEMLTGKKSFNTNILWQIFYTLKK